MKVLSVLFSVLMAGPVNNRLVVQKSCQTTCSGEADNFSQYTYNGNTSNTMLRLDGTYALNFAGLRLCWFYIESIELNEKIKLIWNIVDFELLKIFGLGCLVTLTVLM